MNCVRCEFSENFTLMKAWCKRLGMVVYPCLNSNADCCYYKEDTRENDPSAYPHGVHPGDPYP